MVASLECPFFLSWLGGANLLASVRGIGLICFGGGSMFRFSGLQLRSGEYILSRPGIAQSSLQVLAYSSEPSAILQAAEFPVGCQLPVVRVIRAYGDL